MTKERIALSSKVWDVVRAIDNDEVYAVCDPNDGKLYVFNTRQVYLGYIIYTIFDAETRFPEESFTVRFGSKHTIHDVIYNPVMIKKRLDKIMDTKLPYYKQPKFNPKVIPGCTSTYPTS